MYAHVKRNWIILVLIIFIGSAIRIIGTNWGLPTYLHPDEGTVVDSAIRMAEHHSFEPDVFNRPDHLEIQLDMISFVSISHVFYHATVFEVAHAYLPSLYLAARLLTALFGIGMIVIGYLIGAKIKKEIGLIAAFLFALFPGFIEFSHYATPDIPTGFFMLLCILFCINYLQSPTAKNIALVCFSIAAFTTIKYPGLILCTFAAIVVILQGIRDKNVKRIIKHGIATILLVPGFIFIMSPVLFTNYQEVIKNLIGESNPNRPGADGLGYLGNINFYFQTYMIYSGLLLAAFFLAGVYVFAKKKLSMAFIPVFFSFIYLILLSYIGLHWERWAVPMYVSPLLISSIGVYYSFVFIKQAHFKRAIYLKTAFYAVVVIVVVNFSLMSTAKLTNLLMPDSRVIGQTYVDANGITKSNTIFEGYTPFLPNLPMDLPTLKEVGDKYYPKSNIVKYVILSDRMYGRYISDPQRFPDKVKTFNAITHQYKLIKQYSPASEDYSSVDLLNIGLTVKYLYQMEKVGYTGPNLMFFKVQ